MSRIPKRKPIQVGPEEGGRLHLKSEDEDQAARDGAKEPAPGDANPTGEHGRGDYDRRKSSL